MTAHPEQLWLLASVPRRLERGEHECCLRCGRGGDGTYGPPGLESIYLSDGAEHTVRLEDQWLCMRHARLEWDHWRECQRKLPERLRVLRAHAHLERHGWRGTAKWAEAQRLLADPQWHPPTQEGT